MSAQPIYDSQGQPHYPTTITAEQTAAVEAERAARIQAAVTARQQREAAVEAERAARAAAEGAAALASYREQAHAAWLAAGGSAAEFTDAAWPRLRREHLLAQAEERLTRQQRAVAQTREEMRARGAYQL